VADHPTLLHALAWHAERPSAEVGYRWLDAAERPTFLDAAQTLDRALRAAAAYAARGARPGDVVALMLPTGPAFLDAWLGAQLAGLTPVALYPPVRLGRLDEFFDRTAAALITTGAVALVSEPRIRRLLGQLVARYQPPRGLIDVADLLDPAPAPLRLPDPSDVQMIQLSSGTTGTPKPVVLTHGQTLANAAVISDVVRAAAPADAPPAGVSWLPLYHDMGLIGCVFPPLLVPGTITLIAPEVFLTRPAVWLRALSTYQATISPAPDFAYALCVERVKDEELTGCDLSRWRLALDGAEPVSPRVAAAFTDRFAKFGLRPEALTPVYGLAEMALAVTFSDWRTPLRTHTVDGVDLVSVGTPLPGYGVRVVGPDGAPLPADVPGRLHVRGPSRMVGWLGREDTPFVGEWLDTGDLGLLHDGELYITGRAKDVLIVRGRNHAPHELERAVDAVPGVRTGCAAAVADLSDGERILLFVEVRERTSDQAQACLDAVRGATGVEVALVVLLDPGTLPRTSSGKIRRSATLTAWRAGTLTPPDHVGPALLAGAFAASAWGFLKARWGR
jgi:fatty-acyl-CoA synthase